jgi:3-isopropylmalate dehydratase small subunit
MPLRGHVHKYGADINTDVIIPARYLNTSDPQELAQHCMEDEDAEFVRRVRPGDIIVATTNFGCGSSREHWRYLSCSAGRRWTAPRLATSWRWTWSRGPFAT